MRNRDYDLGNESISRLDAVKHAVRLFVAGGEHGLAGRPNDKIGVITFARDPDVVCPLTLDHQAVLDAVNDIKLAPPVGTNIGDALAWALDRLRHDPTKQKVVVLLTDGGHNVKEGMPPPEAAQLAADLKIKVYTIGAVGNRFGRPAQTLADVRARSPGDTGDGRFGGRAADGTDGLPNRGQYYRATRYRRPGEHLQGDRPPGNDADGEDGPRQPRRVVPGGPAAGGCSAARGTRRCPRPGYCGSREARFLRNAEKRALLMHTRTPATADDRSCLAGLPGDRGLCQQPGLAVHDAGTWRDSARRRRPGYAS